MCSVLKSAAGCRCKDTSRLAVTENGQKRPLFRIPCAASLITRQRRPGWGRDKVQRREQTQKIYPHLVFPQNTPRRSYLFSGSVRFIPAKYAKKYAIAFITGQKRHDWRLDKVRERDQTQEIVTCSSVL